MASAQTSQATQAAKSSVPHFSCPDCTKSCTTKNGLSNHLRSTDHGFSCPTKGCRGIFTTQSALDNHMNALSHHESASLSNPPKAKPAKRRKSKKAKSSKKPPPQELYGNTEYYDTQRVTWSDVIDSDVWPKSPPSD